MKEKQDKSINPFKLINKVDELPLELKREVMATINYAHLAIDMVKLFSLDMAKTANEIIEPLADNDDDKIDRD